MIGAAPPPPADTLVDGLGRKIVYLRLSLTDRCNFHCSYCSPAALETHEDPLTRLEVARLVRVFAGLGIAIAGPHPADVTSELLLKDRFVLVCPREHALARARLGGVTGDVYGATCELVECAVLVLACVHF